MRYYISHRRIYMPELSRFYGIIIKMYFNDVQQHHKPHIHAFYGDYEAVIAVDGELLAGSIPAKQLKNYQRLACHIRGRSI